MEDTVKDRAPFEGVVDKWAVYKFGDRWTADWMPSEEADVVPAVTELGMFDTHPEALEAVIEEIYVNSAWKVRT